MTDTKSNDAPVFVVQKQIWEERNYGFFLDSLRNYGTVIEVEIIPFTDELIPEELEQLDDEDVFVKPQREKLFTGLVISPRDLKTKAFDSLVQCSTTHVDELRDEVVFVSDPVSITKEYRFFVFNNKIATGSSYGKANTNGYERVSQEHYLWGMTQSLIDSFKREIIGIVDVTLHEGEVKIIELNNLNSAGIYECDPESVSFIVTLILFRFSLL